MELRTIEEIKAYVEGYNACFDEFCRQLKSRKSLLDAKRKMEIMKDAINKVIEGSKENED